MDEREMDRQLERQEDALSWFLELMQASREDNYRGAIKEVLMKHREQSYFGEMFENARVMIYLNDYERARQEKRGN
ncbi:hypothetical protein HY450_01745 [Candidatus Pacearchaeota archaeon]|nr:hypothetical protein [Candidatus Pacearchaeota archaeon]